jgi:hypothetical protein
MTQIAKFAEIKKQLKIEDNNLYFYTTEADGTLTLRQADEYEILAEEGLQEVYDEAPDDLWEKCLED